MKLEMPGQLELPATPARPADLLRIKAAAPLRGTADQQPCDVGLFSDDAKQIDLFNGAKDHDRERL